MLNWNDQPKMDTIFNEALKANTEMEAQKFMSEYLAYMVKHNPDKAELDLIADIKSNLAYFAGYYSTKERLKIEKLYNCEHPYFGSVEKNGIPTAEQAFKMGLEMGKKMRENGSN